MNLNNLINKIGIKQEKENKALDAYVENYDKNRDKLETLLSEFGEIINDDAALELWKYKGANDYYNYVCEKINNFDFDIENVNLLTGNLHLYEIIRNDYEKNAKSGLLLSALINKAVKAGEKVQITALMPIDYLFYKLENAEAYVNIAGTNLGSRAKNSKIYAYEAGELTGCDMENCELHVKKAGDHLGKGAKNSKIYAEKAGNSSGWDMQGCELHVKKADHYLGSGAKNSKIYAYEAGELTGCNMEDCELHVKKAGNYLGDSSKNSMIYADEAGNFPGWDMQECELHVRKAGEYLGDGATKSRIYADYTGNHAGWDMDRSKLHVRKAGEYLGDRAIKSKIYADEAGTHAGKDMENSELFIYKLDGKLYRGCLKGENRIYLGGESYYEHYLRYKLTGVKVWEKKT